MCPRNDREVKVYNSNLHDGVNYNNKSSIISSINARLKAMYIDITYFIFNRMSLGFL